MNVEILGLFKSQILIATPAHNTKNLSFPTAADGCMFYIEDHHILIEPTFFSHLVELATKIPQQQNKQPPKTPPTKT